MQVNQGYESLAAVLQRALNQAQDGKGAERHANRLPFHEQPMQTIAGQVGVGFLLGQAMKKTQESQMLPHARGIAELLGAINYLAGAVIFLEAAKPTLCVPANDNTMKCKTPGPFGSEACVQCITRGSCLGGDLSDRTDG